MRRLSRYVMSLAFTGLLAGPAIAQGTASIPPMGSPERRAIMDDLRKARQTPDQIFVVETLKVSGGWAYAVIKPQTKGGKQRFETESLVLQQRSGHWQIVDAVCTEDDVKDAAACDLKKSIARVRKTNPHVPDAIFR